MLDIFGIVVVRCANQMYVRFTYNEKFSISKYLMYQANAKSRTRPSVIRSGKPL